MNAHAVVLHEPKRLSLIDLALKSREDDDVVVAVHYSGVSTGTEKLFWSGTMPPFPGMGYPLVPGYETVGEVVEAGPTSGRKPGDFVFVPGASCYRDMRGLFGGASSRIITPGNRTTIAPRNAQSVLMALAATAYHALQTCPNQMPDLIIGHGVLGRLIARLAIACGAPAPTVWETDPGRRTGAQGYTVVDPAEDERRDYGCICDASGDSAILDPAIRHLSRGGTVVLAGFYDQRVGFAFAPAFIKECAIRIAAEWRPEDLAAVSRLVDEGRLPLDGLITHRSHPEDADNAYQTSFFDRNCLKMILDWRDIQ